MFIVLFTIMAAGCESATGGGSSGKDQDTLDQCPSGNCSADTAVGEESPFDSAQGDNKETGYCGDGVCGIFEGDTPENCLNCLEDCPCSLGLVCNDVGVCEADPLADYYWLEGQWKDQIGFIYDITVTDWDDKKGAQVHGFSPCSLGWAIKDGDGSQLLFSGQSESGNDKCSDGKIDVLNKKNVFTATFPDEDPIVFTYIKL